MSLLVKTKRPPFPSLVSDFFNNNRLLPGYFDFDGDLLDLNGSLAMVPNVNISEKDGDFTIEMAAPGLEKKDFNIKVENGVLTISAEKEEEKMTEDKNYKRREFSYNSFSRSFTLPENSVADKIAAKYENGVLNLTLPKKEVTTTKAVKEIKVS